MATDHDRRRHRPSPPPTRPTTRRRARGRRADAAAADAPVVFDVPDLERLLRHASGPSATSTSQIRQHEITAFIGPSGCGKTTVLRCFNRMNDLIDGAPGRGQAHATTASTCTAPRSTRSRCAGASAWCSRSRTRSPSRSTTTSPSARGSPGMKGNLDDIVEQALRRRALWDEVKDRLKTSALGLSGGQQQRLCIARAIAVEPEVVLMDEPCSALDPIATARIEDLMQEIKSEYTIVIVTHNMQQAARVSDRTAFFTAEVDRDQRHPHRRARRVRPHRADLLEPADERTENYVTGRFG